MCNLFPKTCTEPKIRKLSQGGRGDQRLNKATWADLERNNVGVDCIL